MKAELMQQLAQVKTETDQLIRPHSAKKQLLLQIGTGEARPCTKITEAQLRELEEHRSSLHSTARKLVEKLCVIEAVEQPNEYGDEVALKELHQLLIVEEVPTYQLTTEQFELLTDYVNIHRLTYR